MTTKHTVDIGKTLLEDRERFYEAYDKLFERAPARPHVHDARCTNCGKSVRIFADDHHHVIGKLIDWLKWVDGLCGKCWSDRKDLQK